MIIRKLFRYEMGHVVRRAWSRRCSRNVHGHSFILEVFLKGNAQQMDNGQMLTDFGFIKKWIHPFVDSFDHSFLLWQDEETQEIRDFFCKNYERIIITPWSSSAEAQALMFYRYVTYLCHALTIKNLWENGEQNVSCAACRVHETITGYAEASEEDLTIQEKQNPLIIRNILSQIKFSPRIQTEWPKDFPSDLDRLNLTFEEIPWMTEFPHFVD